jgi:hypothetical protein
MKISHTSHESITTNIRSLIVITTAILLGGFLSCNTGPREATPPVTQTPIAQASPSPSPKDAETQRREQWEKEIGKVPVPKKGCFTTSYPKKEWQEVPCKPPSKYPNPPRNGPRPNVIGNGNDISTRASGLTISSARGSFDSVTPGTVTETGLWNGNATSPNAFTLQINSQFFNTTVCAGHAGCQGWQQFIYSQNQCSGPCIFMEYWLINFGNPCPAGPWIQFGAHCFFNSASSGAPAVTAAQLQGTTLTGTASATTDTVVLTSPGGNANAMANDNVVNLSQSWNTAEWNIVGDCCSAQANFSAGTTIVPRLTINDGTQQAPTCVAAGFTGETNNLNYGPGAPTASGVGPALFFNQSIVGGIAAAARCMAATSIGDTHLMTTSGLLYDFQASGDFVLVQVDPDFVVQARQVSGTPTWPDASVNKAVATQMGRDKVAICLAPTRVNVDGTNRDVGDGSTVSTPDGVDVTRRGNVYFITDQTGNSLRATINNDTWIDVEVGIGHWPATMRGLLANANGNVNQLAARDGTVLTNPFSFEEFYQRYGESWRVSPRESLLSVCEAKEVEQGNPGRPFFAKDLEPNVRQHAMAVCTAAGVKPGPLFDACTLDVAVIGRDDAAKVFVSQPEPVAVGQFTGSGAGSVLKRWWWLWLLLLIIIILVIVWILRKKKP